MGAGSGQKGLSLVSGCLEFLRGSYLSLRLYVVNVSALWFNHTHSPLPPHAPPGSPSFSK